MAANKDLIAVLEPLVRRVRTDVTAAKGQNGMAWTDEPLTQARLAKHLNGGPARGVCPIKAGESVTMVGVLDFDSHKGESSWDEMTAAAELVTAELLARGLQPVPWRSSGGRGIHLIMLWDEPQDAHSVRMLLVEALAACGYANGNAGVSRKQIEVFPKQDKVELGRHGNQFILPLAGHSELLFPELGWEALGKDAALGMAWPSSAPVSLVEKPVRTNSAAVIADRNLLDRALRAIPNTIDDRDEWFVLMCAYAEGGGDKEVARAWSSQHGTHDDERFDKAWDSITVGKEGGTPAGYLLTVAEAHGFNEHIVEAFDAVEPVPCGEGVLPPLELPRKSSTGKIEPTATHVQLALSRPDYIGFKLAVDEFMGRRVIAAEGADTWTPFKDSDYFALRVRLEEKGFKTPSQEMVREAVRLVAERNAFDSAEVWANGLRWDGVPRVEQFFERYLGAAADGYSRAVSRYMWTALAARCLVPGYKVDMVPVLIGDQGSGKTSMVETIAPTDEVFVEINLEKRDDENLARSLRGKLVGELGELRGLQTKDAEAIKAWVSRRHEEIRALYSEFHGIYKRRLVLIGTTNRVEFLDDDTGERRWLPLHVGVSDLDALRADRDQLWAEGVALFKAQGLIWREAQTLALGRHDAHKIKDPWQPAIARWLLEQAVDDDGRLVGLRPWRTDAVLTSALGIDARFIDRKAQNRVGRVMRQLGYESGSARENGVTVTAWKPLATCKILQEWDLA